MRAFQQVARMAPGNKNILYDLIRISLKNDKLSYSNQKAAELIERLDDNPQDYINLANLFLKEDHGRDITDIFIDSINSESEPSCIAVGYSLCKLENLVSEMEKMLPLVEAADISTEQIETIYGQFETAAD